MAMSIYHMPVSKVLKSKVKKTLQKIATSRRSINFFETDTFENVPKDRLSLR